MSKSSKSPVFNLGLSDKMEAELLELLRDLTSNKKVDHSRVLPNLSQAELTILRSNSPIGVTDSEEITVFGQRGMRCHSYQKQNLLKLVTNDRKYLEK